ncbi:MAG: hypothetical protein NC517_08940 [Firmicutes bacterium]|nr:hypothetical protein [Bacillota bacterium]
MDWKEDSLKMFFQGGRSINEITEATGVSRQSISAFLGRQPGYVEERQRRKAANAVRRREYKREKNREYRSSQMGGVTAETMKREHDVAAAILSRERYYG